MNEREIVAHHEAGHAIASLSVNMRFQRVTIVPDGEAQGRCSHRRPKHYHPDCQSDRRTIHRVKREIFSLLAGPVAEWKLTGKRNPASSTNDFEDAVRLACYLCGSDQEVGAYMDFMWEYTKNALTLNWKAVQEIAHQLVRHKTLSYRRTKSLVEDLVTPVNLV